jgi:outer membrane protein assembly factor BamB
MLISAMLLLAGTVGLQAAYPEIMWWFDLDAPSLGSASVGDLDGDNYLEIVFGTYFNDERIIALNAEAGDTLWTFFTDGCNDASSAIADVDLDGELEVIAPASSPCMVYCLNGADGSVEWHTPTGSHPVDSPPTVADVDNDDLPEVIFGAWHGYVYCLNGENGSECWLANLGSNSFIQSGPNILDVDDNGQLDVVVAQWAGDFRVYALRGDDHSIIWYSDEPDDDMYHGGSFADVDEDGRPEIAIGSYDNNVYLLNAENGSLEWEYSSAYYVGAPTSIADLNNDGHLEVVFVSYNRLTVLSHLGDYLWSYSTGGNMFRGAAIADIDADDTLDVVFGSDDGVLRVLQGSDGSVVWTCDLEAHYGRTFQIDHAPVVADFDNDGGLDIFIIGGYATSSNPSLNHGRAYAIRAGAGQGPGWPMFRHDLRHSACFSEPEIICGDSDGNAAVNISDVVYLLAYIFADGQPPQPRAAGDTDCSGRINLSDAVRLLAFILGGGPVPCDVDADGEPDC